MAGGDGDAFVELYNDGRFYPTAKKMKALFARYAPKGIGLASPVLDNSLHNYIFHLRHKRPMAMLFLDEPRSGKTSVAAAFVKEDIPRVLGDIIFPAIMRGRLAASPAMQAIIGEWSDGVSLNSAAVVYHICKQGLLPELCAIIDAQCGHRDFVLDMYVSRPWRKQLAAILEGMGYFIASVSIEKSGVKAKEQEKGGEAARGYREYLEKNIAPDI